MITSDLKYQSMNRQKNKTTFFKPKQQLLWKDLGSKLISFFFLVIYINSLYSTEGIDLDLF
ncbi:Uncharacterised protein [Chlamydia trachomatis]|nr:Uncharacterised protein [Chlamydia trachomatis]